MSAIGVSTDPDPVSVRFPARAGVLLSVVVPTFNESGNVAEMVRRLDAALSGYAWEAIFVDDDSPDGTAHLVKQLAMRDPRVRCVRRLQRRGLAGACIEGILSSSAPFVAVMDGDLQHDERLLSCMLDDLLAGRADIAVGSRHVPGGSDAGLKGLRGNISRWATKLTHRVLGADLADPMSGFFMMRREDFESIAPHISPVGFKILLDVAITTRGRLRVHELPYVFRARAVGESKFDTQVGLEFLGLILAKMTGGLITPRFLVFALVGTTGLGLHLTILRFALAALALGFPAAQGVATLTAMVSNFLLNNVLTYRDRRLKGRAMITGFAGFAVIGGVGAITNVGVASWLYSEHSIWWVAGAAGALMGALWNYSMSSQLVWRTR